MVITTKTLISPQLIHQAMSRPDIALEVSNAVHKFCPLNGIVFDPMCGSGTFVLLAQKHERNAFGYDISPLMVEFARLNLRVNKLKPSVFVGDARFLEKVRDKSIDLVLTSFPSWKSCYSNEKNAIERKETENSYVKDVVMILREIKRVLKLNGHLLVVQSPSMVRSLRMVAHDQGLRVHAIHVTEKD